MLQILPVPAFADNYIWTLVRGSHAVVVDPGDAEPVLALLEQRRLALGAILVTHRHGDHAGGVAELLRAHPAPVYGPRAEAIAGVTRPCGEGDCVELPGLGLKLAVLEVPGHTAGHIAFHGAGMLFCGDTLFACGCGRLFEGTAAQLHASLMRLAALAPETRVYCAHEYTLANLRFARSVEPGNAALAGREAEARALRERGLPTLPSTIALERATNPFLRAALPGLRRAAEALAGRALEDPVEVFAALRTAKDGFR